MEELYRFTIDYFDRHFEEDVDSNEICDFIDSLLFRVINNAGAVALNAIGQRAADNNAAAMRKTDLEAPKVVDLDTAWSDISEMLEVVKTSLTQGQQHDFFAHLRGKLDEVENR